MQRRPDRTTWLVLGIILAAFLVRARGLGAQSFWFDEALSVDFARTPVADFPQRIAAVDIHPPLYLLMLHFWMRLTGTAAYALRYLALLPSVLSVPLTYQLGAFLLRSQRRQAAVVSPTTRPSMRAVALIAPTQPRTWPFPAPGVLAAFLVCTSPALIRAAQTNRNYSLLVFSVLAASYAYARLVYRPKVGIVPVLVYGTTLAFAGYTHYLGWLVLPAHALFTLLTRQGRRRVKAILLAWGVTLLVYLPWVPGADEQLLRLSHVPDFWHGTLNVASLLLQFLSRSLAPGALSGARLWIALAGAGVLLAGGIVAGIRQSHSERRWQSGVLFLSLCGGIPVALTLAAAWRHPKFADRYLITALPFGFLVAGAALQGVVAWLQSATGGFPRERVWAFWRVPAQLVLSAVVTLSCGAAIVQATSPYADPATRHGDARDTVRYIQAHHRPGDAIVLVQDWSPVFSYYAGTTLGKQGTDWIGIVPYNNFAFSAAVLNQFAATHRRIWLAEWHVQWADPSYFVQGQLQMHATLVDEKSFPSFSLQLYNLRPGARFSAQPEPARPITASFGDSVLFLGGRVLAAKVHFADTPVHLETWWHLTAPVPDRSLWVDVRLVRDGILFGEQESPIGMVGYSLDRWAVGVPTWREFDVTPFRATPPGDYDVEISLYSRAKRQNLSAISSGRQALGTIIAVDHVQIGPDQYPLRRGNVPMDHQVRAAVAPGLTLLGDSFTASKPIEQGQQLPVTLFWQATATPAGQPRARLLLHDAAGKTVATDEQPITALSPFASWSPGDIVRDPRSIVVTAAAQPGAWTLDVQVDGGSTIPLGSIEVRGRPHQMTPPPAPQHPLDARFGHVGTLRGVTVDTSQAQPGGSVGVTLYWKAISTPNVSYKVFVHLLDAQGQVGDLQDDEYPARGTAPTPSWVPGEWVLDPHRIPLPAWTKPGVYTLEVGLYDLRTAKRVSLPDGQTRVLAGHVTVR